MDWQTSQPCEYDFSATSDIRKLDLLSFLGMLSGELFRWFVGMIAVVLLVPPLGSALTIFSNGKLDRPFRIGLLGAIAVVLLIFGFQIGREKNDDRAPFKLKLFLQWCWWAAAIGVFWWWLMQRGDSELILGCVASAFFLAAGAPYGCRFATPLKDPEWPLSWRTIVCRFVIGPVLAVLLLIGYGLGLEQLNYHAERIQWHGKPAPNHVFRQLDDQPWSLEDHLGKVVLLDFAFSRFHCFDERKEIFEEFGSHDEFVMVTIVPSSATVSRTYQDQAAEFFQTEAGWKVLRSGPNSIDSTPGVYVVDQNGTIALAETQMAIREPSTELIRRTLERLLTRSDASSE